MKKGDRVTFIYWGKVKTGVVDYLSRDRSIVFLEGGRWLHRRSVMIDAPTSTHVNAEAS